MLKTVQKIYQSINRNNKLVLPERLSFIKKINKIPKEEIKTNYCVIYDQYTNIKKAKKENILKKLYTKQPIHKNVEAKNNGVIQSESLTTKINNKTIQPEIETKFYTTTIQPEIETKFYTTTIQTEIETKFYTIYKKYLNIDQALQYHNQPILFTIYKKYKNSDQVSRYNDTTMPYILYKKYKK